MRVQLPDGWNEVTIGQYQEIVASEGDDRLIEVISILSDQDPEDIRKMHPDSLPAVLNQIDWVKKLPESGEYKPIIEIDGEKYGFINRLADLTIGEWIDLESWITKSNDNIHKIMALLYRPLVSASNDNYRVVDKYVVAEANERAKLFQNKMMIGDVYGALLFFSLIESEFLKITPKYLAIRERKERIAKMPWMKRSLIKASTAMRGWLLSMFWPKEISQKWMRFLDRIFYSRSTSDSLNSITNP